MWKIEKIFVEPILQMNSIDLVNVGKALALAPGIRVDPDKKDVRGFLLKEFFQKDKHWSGLVELHYDEFDKEALWKGLLMDVGDEIKYICRVLYRRLPNSDSEEDRWDSSDSLQKQAEDKEIAKLSLWSHGYMLNFKKYRAKVHQKDPFVQHVREVKPIVVPLLIYAIEFLEGVKSLEPYGGSPEHPEELGVDTIPVLVGPVCYLLLSNLAKEVEKSFYVLPLMPKILPIYK